MKDLRQARLELCDMLNKCETCELPLQHRRPGQKKRNTKYCATTCNHYIALQEMQAEVEALQLQRRGLLGINRSGSDEQGNEEQGWTRYSS